MFCRALKLVFAFSFLFAQIAAAEPNYHVVGWTNFFVPGGGKLLLGEYRFAAEQAALEIGTFTWGYSLSARTPFTLDGVPEDLPSPEVGIFQRPSTTVVCIARDVNGNCTKSRVRHNSTTPYDSNTKDITQPLFADILQEIGLKSHMVNIYDSYRQAAEKQGVNLEAAQIDSTPTRDLFLAPFDHHNVFDDWVWIPLVLTAGALFYSYSTLQSTDYPTLPQFTAGSRALYSATYLGVFPIGSAAPEEMFYRGFIQSEAYALTSSRWAAVPISAGLYTLSHSPDEQLAAAVSGLFLGILTAHENGKLKLGITYHFWSDVLTGIYSIAVVKLGQKAGSANPAGMNFNFSF